MQPDIQQLFGLILLKNPSTNSLDLYDAPDIFLEGVFPESTTDLGIKSHLPGPSAGFVTGAPSQSLLAAIVVIFTLKPPREGTRKTVAERPARVQIKHKQSPSLQGSLS